ncbi:MAG: Stp1/IreP family PP2C-type Ser/Thr phosphatase [Candidatus Binataceae bacterium]|nr:Stp1/IreP family PP2C-type Ser/Thr phosphatase [Candidatus Binataceae bacterium]
MLTCPQCGQTAPEGTRFCDRCGQGLIAPSSEAASPVLDAIAPGTALKHGFEIVELLTQSSIENRYRVVRKLDSARASFQIRERTGPASSHDSDASSAEITDPAIDDVAEAAGGSRSEIVETENCVDPRAKTAELKPIIIDAKAQPAEAVETSASATAVDEVETTPAESPISTADGTPQIVAPESESNEQDTPAVTAAASQADEQAVPAEDPAEAEDLGEVFGRVLALSQTLKHAAFQRALEGFADGGRVYLAYPDEPFTPLAARPGGLRMPESEALNVAIQLCQAVGYLHRRGLRLNDICPESVGYGADGRVRVTGLESVSNDNELQSDPIFNDGFTAPEIYRGKKADKRADIFSIGALLYTCLTGDRLESESWREEAGAIDFYPPHVVSPALEQVVRRALVFNPDGRWPNVDAMKAELVKLGSTIRIRAGVMTDVGMVRELNEDIVMAQQYYRDSQVEPAESYLYVVCDGMGGAEAGEIAASIAVSTIRDYIQNQGSRAENTDLAQALRSALEDANSKILEYVAAHPEARGMGSTAVALIVTPPLAAVAWVGDSRAYLLENGALRQLTKDHSLVQRLVEIGQITLEEARHHEHKNVITRSLGARASGPAGAEAVNLRLKRGDRLMLCSDGLIAHVDDPAIAEVMRRHSDPLAATRELVVAANAGGGTDNVSVIVVFAD